jgi:outer membrane protein TolC
MEKAAFYPQVSLVAQYGQTNNPMYSFGNILNQRAFSPDIDFNRPGRTDDLNNSIQLGYRFFDGGQRQAGLTAAEAQTAAARFELAAVRDRLAFEVVRACRLIDQAGEMVKIQQAEAATVASAKKTAQARFEEGLLLRSHLLDLEVQEAQVREGLVTANHNLTLARQLLLNLLGLNDGTIELDGGAEPEQEIPTGDAAGKRPELASLDAALAAAAARIRLARAARYPTLDGFAGYGYDQGSITGGESTSWQAGLKFQYSLFDGHRAEAGLAQASAMVAELKEKRRRTELAVGLEIKQARLALADAEERLAVSDQSVAQGAESLRITSERFGEGLVLATDLIAVQNRLVEAQVRRAAAVTGRRIAIADLRRALGLPQYADLTQSSVTE